MEIKDFLSFKDDHEKHGLRGHVAIYRENMETGEVSLWEESDNIIPISGYQWILMKMFGLYLDSKHDPSDATKYEVIGQDSTIAIPDLNARTSLPIGKNVNNYTPMVDDIAANHFCQGFMVGNRGGAEDGITTKNTDYSYVALRNPIPFQQTNESSLSSSIAGQYLGVLNGSATGSTEAFAKSYYIKKFDERPHIYHSWWRDNQKWDYIDPVSVTDLGPTATTSNKTNRIESYVECKLSLSDDDCFSYFNREGNTETPAINELGLVAFDTDPGARSDLEKLYSRDIKQLISFIFDNNRPEEVLPEIVRLTAEILDAFENVPGAGTAGPITRFNNSHINNFVETLNRLSGETVEKMIADPTIFTSQDPDNPGYQMQLSDPENIAVTAYYNQKQEFIFEEDEFLHNLSSDEFNELTTDEAQRIKLITYYTFNSIPLQKNWRTLIYYRIYAN